MKFFDRIKNKDEAAAIIAADSLLCRVCEISKSLSKYYPNKRSLLGVSRTCKDCVKAANKKHYQNVGRAKPSEEQRLRAKHMVELWYRKNIVSCRLRGREYSNKYSKELRDAYVSNILKNKGIKATPDMIELQRAKLKLKRLYETL